MLFLLSVLLMIALALAWKIRPASTALSLQGVPRKEGLPPAVSL